jgi:hypothetical protein
MRAAPLPLFPEPLPFQRPSIAGWKVDDRVAFGPALPGLERRGRVITMLPSFDLLVIRTDDHTLAEVTPSRCRKLTR